MQLVGRAVVVERNRQRCWVSQVEARSAECMCLMTKDIMTYMISEMYNQGSGSAINRREVKMIAERYKEQIDRAKKATKRNNK